MNNQKPPQKNKKETVDPADDFFKSVNPGRYSIVGYFEQSIRDKEKTSEPPLKYRFNLAAEVDVRTSRIHSSMVEYRIWLWVQKNRIPYHPNKKMPPKRP